MGWEAPFESLALGRLVKWVGFFALLAIFAVLLLVYLRLSGGQLPFAFRDLAGVPPWAPFLAYLGGFVIAAVAPRVIDALSPRPTTFYDLEARNRRNSVFLAVATVLGNGLTAYVLFTVVSLHASVGFVAALVSTGAASALAIATWIAGDRIVLTVSGARPVDPAKDGVSSTSSTRSRSLPTFRRPSST